MAKEIAFTLDSCEVAGDVGSPYVDPTGSGKTLYEVTITARARTGEKYTRMGLHIWAATPAELRAGIKDIVRDIDADAMKTRAAVPGGIKAIVGVPVNMRFDPISGWEE